MSSSSDEGHILVSATAFSGPTSAPQLRRCDSKNTVRQRIHMMPPCNAQRHIPTSAAPSVQPCPDLKICNFKCNLKIEPEESGSGSWSPSVNPEIRSYQPSFLATKPTAEHHPTDSILSPFSSSHPAESGIRFYRVAYEFPNK